MTSLYNSKKTLFLVAGALFLYLSFFFFLSVPFVSAVTWNIDSITVINVTGTNIWNTTSLGPLSDANSTQFDNNTGALTIDESWLSSFGNNLWCRLIGCTMQGDINMDGNNITNVGTITADNFIGDGSGLTNLPGDIDNDFHIFFNMSMYNNIIYNLTAGDTNDIEVLTEPGKKFIFGDIFI